MFTLFMILAVIVALVLFPAILLQAGQGGGLATQFGGQSSTDAFVGGRQAATILHKGAWWAGGLFLFFCFVLGLMSGGSTATRSITGEQINRQRAAEQQAPPSSQQAAPPLPLETQPAPTDTAKRP
jgi:protein translocase SecG subunit